MTGPVTERWQLSEVPAAFAELVPLAEAFGFHCTLFGSVVKAGAGRDLDVAMLGLFGRQRDWRGFLAAFGGVMVRQLERPERGNHSYEVARAGRLYHFIFGRF